MNEYQNNQFDQNAQPYQQPVQNEQSYQQPVQNWQQPVQPIPPVQPQWQPAIPAKKSNNVLISMIAGFLCIIMAFSSVAYACSVRIFDIPIISFVFNMAGEDVDEEFDVMISEMDDEVDEMSGEDEEEFEDIMGVTPDEFVDDFSRLSINSMIKWGDNIVDAADEIEGFDFDSEELASFYYLHGLRLGLYIYAAFISLFVLLGTLLKRKALTIVGMVLGALYILTLGGVVFLVLFLVTGIVQCVFATRYRKELKAASQPPVYPAY